MPRRRRRVSRLSLFYFVVTSGLLLGGSLWLDRRGELTTARVTTKQEEITVLRVPAGGWYRWHRLGVEFDTRGGRPGMATVTVPEQRYDALHPGDTIQVRHLPFFPLLARAADQSTGLVARDAVIQFAADPFLLRLILWLVAGAAALWLAARIATPVVVLAGLAWIALGLPFLFPAPSPLPPMTAESTARVSSVTLVTMAPVRSGSQSRSRAARMAGDSVRRLAMPYEVVQLRFAPEGRTDSVVAVDVVDSASVAGLMVGSIVPIGYDTAAPREARMTLGSRTFRERNRYHMLGPMIGVGVLGMLGAWGWRHRRIRRTRATSATGESPGTPSSVRAGG
jgi:hypothetical protein